MDSGRSRQAWEKADSLGTQPLQWRQQQPHTWCRCCPSLPNCSLLRFLLLNSLGILLHLADPKLLDAVDGAEARLHESSGNPLPSGKILASDARGTPSAPSGAIRAYDWPTAAAAV